MQNDVNMPRTNAHESTEGVPGAFTVPADLKHHMRVLRKKFGASSKIGRLTYNVDSAIESLLNPDADKVTAESQRIFLPKSIKRQLEGIARLASQP